jgi:hypothetical protein
LVHTEEDVRPGFSLGGTAGAAGRPATLAPATGLSSRIAWADGSRRYTRRFLRDERRKRNDMAGDAGPLAKEALLTMVRDCDMRVEGLVELLVAKGVITEADWDQGP